MHPLKVVYAVAIVVALAVAAIVIAWLPSGLTNGGTESGRWLAGAIAFLAVLIPASILFFAILRLAKDADAVFSQLRASTGDVTEEISSDQLRNEELAEIARAAEELRGIAIRQRIAFQHEREATREILSNVGEGLLAVNENQRVVFANSPFHQLFATSEEIAGRRLSEVVRNATVIDAIDRALAGSALATRFELVRGTDQRAIELRVFPVARSGEVAAVALFIDVSRIEMLERMRREFLDDFSHEVRTPLAGLKGAVESFSSGPLADRDATLLHGVMERQIDRIERLIADLSELSGIESGELHLRLTHLDLLQLARDAAADFTERVGDRPIEVSGESVIVYADPLRLQQVIGNLLDNAWKHGRGKVQMTTGLREHRVFLRVSDQGGGIHSSQRERIFQRFFRGDQSRSQAVPGTGLGLAITKHLVLLHGGTIGVVEDGEKTTLELELPTAP